MAGQSTLNLTADYPHPPQKVWRALTSSEALAAWLMPNDFEPIVGRRFQFRTAPAPGFDGIVNCEVLELDPPRRLVYSWRGGPLDTTVTFTLEPIANGGTRLRLEHAGFHGLKQRLIGGMLGRGWKRMARSKLPAVLDRIGSDGQLVPAPELCDHACYKRPLTRLRVALIGLIPGRKSA